jgi:hypothetical protein
MRGARRIGGGEGWVDVERQSQLAERERATMSAVNRTIFVAAAAP